MKLVSRAQARAQIMSDTNADDAHVELLVEAASRVVLDYCNVNIDDFTDTSGEPYAYDTSGDPLNVPRDIQMATLILFAIFYKDREGEAGIINPQWQAGYLPTVVRSLLTKYHDPALA